MQERREGSCCVAYRLSALPRVQTPDLSYGLAARTGEGPVYTGVFEPKAIFDPGRCMLDLRSGIQSLLARASSGMRRMSKEEFKAHLGRLEESDNLVDAFC